MSALTQDTIFTEGSNSHEIGTSNPTNSTDGFEKSGSQTGFFIYSESPYSLWLKDTNGWTLHQTFTSGNLLTGTNYAWGDYTAAYVQTSVSGHVVHLKPRTGPIVIDGNIGDGTNQHDTLVRPGTPTPTDVVVAPVAQFAQWHDVNGHIHPTSNSNYDIGSAEYKVRHLFLSSNSMYIGDTWIKAEGDSVKTPNLLVGDLNLNNTGRQNEVDGTSGHWTIQEGSQDLFLINRTTGKKYRFNITEVEES